MCINNAHGDMMEKKDKKSKLTEFIDFFMLAGGTIVAQLIAIAFSPILSRIYSAEEMGIYTLVITLTGIFESVICLRYDLLLVSSDDNDVPIAKSACIKMCLILSLAITLIYVLYEIIFGEQSFGTNTLFLFNFFLLAGHGLILIATALNNRHKKYKLISASSLTLSTVQYCSSSLFGIFGLGSVGLLLGRVLGTISSFFVSVKFKIVSFFAPLSKVEKVKTEKQFLKENKRQALFSTPAVLSSASAYSLINVFISDLFGVATLGLYGYSYRLLGLPITIISTNINRMFFRDASIEYKKTGTMKKSMFKVLLPLIIIAVMMIIAFKLFAPNIFAWFLGEEWREAGVYVQILAPMFAIRLVANSFTNAIIVVKKQFWELILQMTYLISTIVIYVVAKILNIEVMSFLQIMNILFCFVYGIYFIVLFIMCIKKNKNLVISKEE